MCCLRCRYNSGRKVLKLSALLGRNRYSSTLLEIKTVMSFCSCKLSGHETSESCNLFEMIKCWFALVWPLKPRFASLKTQRFLTRFFCLYSSGIELKIAFLPPLFFGQIQWFPSFYLNKKNLIASIFTCLKHWWRLRDHSHSVWELSKSKCHLRSLYEQRYFHVWFDVEADTGWIIKTPESNPKRLHGSWWAPKLLTWISI